MALNNMNTQSQQSTQALGVDTNKVLRNTYMLLGMTLAFSAIMAMVAMATNFAIAANPIFFLVGYFALLFATMKLRNSPWGLLCVFALTGFLGLTAGPIISFYLETFSNGAELVTLSLGGTAAIFFVMSGYALTTGKNLDGWGRIAGIGILVAFVAALGNMLFGIAALSLAISCVFIVAASMLISWQTQQIVRGGETNYIMATVTLFVMIFNIFMSLLQLLGFSMGED